jgi:hypothetical protein
MGRATGANCLALVPPSRAWILSVEEPRWEWLLSVSIGVHLWLLWSAEPEGGFVECPGETRRPATTRHYYLQADHLISLGTKAASAGRLRASTQYKGKQGRRLRGIWEQRSGGAPENSGRGFGSGLPPKLKLPTSPTLLAEAVGVAPDRWRLKVLLGFDTAYSWPPYWRSSFATSLWPLATARRRGVEPSASLALTSALLASNDSATALWPWPAARCKGVRS